MTKATLPTDTRHAGSGSGVSPSPWTSQKHTALLALADGTIVKGFGIGAEGEAVAEVCFNTAMTGYQEILTDPSYAGQIITFTFPHIGNVGTNDDDIETSNLAASSGVRGLVVKDHITNPSNYRAQKHFNDWLTNRNIIGISGIDTRALTKLIRESGMPHAVIAHNKNSEFDEEALVKQAAEWSGLEGLDLAIEVSSKQQYTWDETGWVWNKGFGRLENPKHHVVAMDFGMKRNILRCLASVGCAVTIVPSTARAEDILAMNPDGIFLSNGPGDPAATGEYAVREIKKLVESGKPVFGICLGHQMLGLALGASTKKMPQGHHGANHPVMDHTTQKVEITSMNHGFTLDRDQIKGDITETHVSLFDGTNSGIALKGKPVFSVQHHPEASPGPQDSLYLFKRFVDYIAEQKG